MGGQHASIAPEGRRRSQLDDTQASQQGRACPTVWPPTMPLSLTGLCYVLCAVPCRRNFKDELEDRTTPDQESEGITCTVKTGPVPTAVPAAAKTGRRMAI